MKRLLLWAGFILGVIFLLGFVLPAIVAGARLAGLINPG